MSKIKIFTLFSLIVILGLSACDSGNIRRTPGHIYAPDMTYGRAYDAYSSNPNFTDKQTSRQPVAGTIARKHQLPDHLKEGDTLAYKTYTISLRFTADEVKEGGRLFNIYCAICHGTGMDGTGPMYSSGKFAAMPANLKSAKFLHVPPGQVYGAIKYGRNMMGSYAAQLDITQRWQVVAYIKKVQSENGGDPFMFESAKTTTDTTNHGSALTAKNEIKKENKKQKAKNSDSEE